MRRKIRYKNVCAFLCLLIMLPSYKVWADQDVCSSSLLKNHQVRDTVGFLRANRNVHRIGDCQIEMQVCQTESEEDHGTVVADLLITTAAGEELYIPINLKQDDYHKTDRTPLMVSQKLFYQWDAHPNIVKGPVHQLSWFINQWDNGRQTHFLELMIYEQKMIRGKLRYKHQAIKCGY